MQKSLRKELSIVTGITLVSVLVLVVGQQFGYDPLSGGNFRGFTGSISSMSMSIPPPPCALAKQACGSGAGGAICCDGKDCPSGSSAICPCATGGATCLTSSECCDGLVCDPTVNKCLLPRGACCHVLPATTCDENTLKVTCLTLGTGTNSWHKGKTCVEGEFIDGDPSCLPTCYPQGHNCNDGIDTTPCCSTPTNLSCHLVSTVGKCLAPCNNATKTFTIYASDTKTGCVTQGALNNSDYFELVREKAREKAKANCLTKAPQPVCATALFCSPSATPPNPTITLTNNITGAHQSIDDNCPVGAKRSGYFSGSCTVTLSCTLP